MATVDSIMASHKNLEEENENIFHFVCYWWFRKTRLYSRLVDLQDRVDFTWRLSDLEELVWHQIKHLGRKETNYFM